MDAQGAERQRVTAIATASNLEAASKTAYNSSKGNTDDNNVSMVNLSHCHQCMADATNIIDSCDSVVPIVWPLASCTHCQQQMCDRCKAGCNELWGTKQGL